MLRYAFAVLLLIVSGSAYGQSTCPFATDGKLSIPVSATIAIIPTPYQIIDCSAFQFVAKAPVNPMISITDNPFTAQAIIKLGIVDGMDIAIVGVSISSVALDEIDIRGIKNVTQNGLFLTGKVFDNFIRVGSIRDVGGNGVIAQTPGGDAQYNVQGNHIEIGQILDSGRPIWGPGSPDGGSGLAFFPGAFANTLIVGPVEWSHDYGCYDEASAALDPKSRTTLHNIWIANGANNNRIGLPDHPDVNSAC